jgi:hypothetical protein
VAGTYLAAQLRRRKSCEKGDGMQKMVLDLLAIVGTGAAATLPCVAGAQSLSDKYAAEIDANHDGAISRNEYSAMTRSHFARYDLNKDGRLTSAERPPYMSREGATTEAEYLQASLKVFVGLDTNNDGMIAGNEVRPFWAHLNRGEVSR